MHNTLNEKDYWDSVHTYMDTYMQVGEHVQLIWGCIVFFKGFLHLMLQSEFGQNQKVHTVKNWIVQAEIWNKTPFSQWYSFCLLLRPVLPM